MRRWPNVARRDELGHDNGFPHRIRYRGTANNKRDRDHNLDFGHRENCILRDFTIYLSDLLSWPTSVSSSGYRLWV